MKPTLENPGWKLGTEETTGVLKCHGRISGYQPIYTEGGEFDNKLICHVHEDIKHLLVANTLATVRERYWIPHLRAKVKKVINDCKLRCARCSVHNRMDWQQRLLLCVVPNRRRTTVRDHRDRLCWTYYLLDLKEGARQMLHVNFHVRYVKSNPFKSNQVTKSRGVKGEGQNASCQITEQFSEPLRHGSRKSERARCCKIT